MKLFDDLRSAASSWGNPFRGVKQGAEDAYYNLGHDLYTSLGSWIPQGRRQKMAQTGFDPEIDNVRRIDQDINNSDPALRYGKLEQRNKELNSWNQKQVQYQPEMRALQEAYIKRQAQQMLQDTAGKQADGFGRQWAQSVGGNENQALQGGNYQLSRGNALETLDNMGGASDGLRRFANGADFLASDDYAAGQGGYGSALGIGYRSMGVAGGSYTGNNSTSAYGANAFNDDGSWDNRSTGNAYASGNIYDSRLQAGNRGSGIGGYRGASKEYLQNIKGWNNFGTYPKKPGADSAPNQLATGDPLPAAPWSSSGIPGMGWMPEESGDTFKLGAEGWRPYQEPSRTMEDDANSWRDYYGDKGYDYRPKSGNSAGWNAGANESRKNMGWSAMAPAYEIASAPHVKSGPKPMYGSGFSAMNPMYDDFQAMNLPQNRSGSGYSSYKPVSGFDHQPYYPFFGAGGF